MMQLRFTGMIDFAGVTVTANGFYGPQGRNSPLESKNPNWLNILAKQTIEGRRITNLEMETAGIYALGSLLNMNCLSLSAILANRQLGTFSKEPEITIKKMIRAALEIFIEPR
jgi:uridine phosphorylase